jgi:fumagillin biosynthesis monooxygenase
MLMGAVVQVALFAVLPARYAVVPPAILTLNAVVSTILQARSSKNAYMADAIEGRVSAQFPDRDSGHHGAQPAAKPVVVFHLGLRFNHPLGILSPGGREVSEYFQQMNKDLAKRADEYGMLHFSTWGGAERASNNTLLLIYYFRDIEGINKFAHDPIHRKGWDWFNNSGIKHIGIFHEAFCALPKAYETLYVNSHPLLMGASNVKCIDEKTGEEAWVSTLVNANIATLRSQFGRMGRAVTEQLRS